MNMPSQASRTDSNDDSQSSEAKTNEIAVAVAEAARALDEKDATKDISNERAMTFPLKVR